MADDVEEQMGDILSAFDITELARDIYVIPLQETGAEERNDEKIDDYSKEEDGDKNTCNSDSKDEGNVKGNGENNGTSYADTTSKDNDGELSVDTGDLTTFDADGAEGSDSEKIQTEKWGDAHQPADQETASCSPFIDFIAPKETDQSSVQFAQALGLKQRVGDIGGGNMQHSAPMIRSLLTSASKSVIIPAPQEQVLQLPHNEDQLEQLPPNQDGQEDIMPSPEVPSMLTSMAEFHSFFDRCKEEKGLLKMKKAILGNSKCLVSYQCPKLTEEQALALQMTKEIFNCPGCEDTFLFKTSLDAHLDRKTTLIQFHCRWCKGRQNVVFINKCAFHAHLIKHGVADKDIEVVKLQAIIFPADAVQSFKIFMSINAPLKNVIPKATPQPTCRQQKMLNQISTGQVQPYLSPAINCAPNVTVAYTTVQTNHKTFQNISGTSQNPPDVSVVPTMLFGPTCSESVPSVDIECFGCKQNFSTRGRYKDHLSQIHENCGLFQCSACKKILNNPCKLLLHIEMHRKTNKFPCPECGIMFRDLQSLLIHESKDCLHFYTKPLFKCRFCLKYATSFQGLVRHFECNHMRIFFKCFKCQLAFRDKDSADDHSMKVHKDVSRAYGLLHKCPFCKSVYSDKNFLQDHFTVHLKKRDIMIEKFVMSCYVCAKPFDSPENLRDHLDHVHRKNSMNIFCCDLCPFTFSDVSVVLSHRTKCADRQKLSSVLYSQRVALQTAKSIEAPPHMANTQSNQVPILSPSARPQQPVRLASTSQNQKVFMCGECGLKFPKGNIEALRQHMLDQHSDKMKAELERLKSNVTAAPNSSAESVANSDKSTITPSNDSSNATFTVERFINLHCGKCEHESTDRVEFERHIETHKKDEHSQCHECGVSFRIKESLRKHLFLKHKIKDMDGLHMMCLELIEKAEEEEKRKKQDEKDKRKQEQEEQKETNSHLDGIETAVDSSANVTEPEDPDPLKCKVCKAEFENEKQFTAHIRSHGLAYLQHRLSKSPEKRRMSPEGKGSSNPNSCSYSTNTNTDLFTTSHTLKPEITRNCVNSTISTDSSEDPEESEDSLE